jgi:hypothetical protein
MSERGYGLGIVKKGKDAMTRRNDDDDADDDTRTGDDVPVVPEAGEGPYPPVLGEPKPPIGN